MDGVPEAMDDVETVCVVTERRESKPLFSGTNARLFLLSEMTGWRVGDGGTSSKLTDRFASRNVVRDGGYFCRSSRSRCEHGLFMKNI